MIVNYSPGDRARPRAAVRLGVIAAFVLIAGGSALLMQPTSSQPPAPPEVESVLQATDASIPNPDFSDIIQGAIDDVLAPPAPSAWNRVIVEKGQTLSSVFESAGLPPKDWMLITQLGGDSRRLKRLKAGDTLDLRIMSGRLEELSYPLDELSTLSIRREGVGYTATTLTAELDRGQAEAVGEIRSSLFADGRKAGLSNRLVMEFADIFGYDIDFAQDLQAGDRFTVVYETLSKDGKPLRDGEILAAEFINQGRVHRAVRFVDNDGRSGYYSPNGEPMRKAFIRTPVDFVRISSGFNLRRRHPILNVIRAHKGVDYAASTGTPVRATGDGKIAFSGRKGGYGNTVVVRHGGDYQTLYAHLSRFAKGIRNGTKVRQGQIIGYVGATGLATAPHLHYEFLVNGIHRNPVTAVLPTAPALTADTLTRFRILTAPLVARIDELSVLQASASR